MLSILDSFSRINSWSKSSLNLPIVKYNLYFIYSILANGRDIYLSQIERDMKCRLQLWTMFISCKIVYTKRTFVELPSNLSIESSCWTHSGWFVFCDSSMNVYRTQPSTPNPEMCIEYTGTNSKTCALLCSTKQGFMLYTVNHLTVSILVNVYILLYYLLYYFHYQVLQGHQRRVYEKLDNSN